MISEEQVKLAANNMRSRMDSHLAGWWNNLMLSKDLPFDGFGLFGPTSYVLHLGDSRILIDPCLREKRWAEIIHERVVSDLNTFDAVLITHEDGDHLDPNFIEIALDADVSWYIPDFIDYSLLHGLNKSKINFIHAGDEIRFGETNIRAFTSNHKREYQTNSLSELGYYITSPKVSCLFPGDVRTYDSRFFGDLVNESPDWMFSHLWLGGGKALSNPIEWMLPDFCKFINDFSPKKIALTHLYETRRTANELWTWRHMGEVADYMLAEYPNIETIFTNLGQWYAF